MYKENFMVSYGNQIQFYMCLPLFVFFCMESKVVSAPTFPYHSFDEDSCEGSNSFACLLVHCMLD